MSRKNSSAAKARRRALRAAHAERAEQADMNRKVRNLVTDPFWDAVDMCPDTVACPECGYPHGYGDIPVPPGFERFRQGHCWHLVPIENSPRA